ncbi:MAG: DUF2461 family protein [Bdellovibrionota bacterium]
MDATPRFSHDTLCFLKKAARQKREDWLEMHWSEYEEVVLEPLKNLAQTLKSSLGHLAPHYNFPQKGIGRLKRSSKSAAQYGGGIYKDWVSYSAARPRQSRFETNPNVFFLINTEDPKDPVLIAGGLYMPSSRQMKLLREAIARDPSPFEKLFETKDFAQSFPKGFSDEKIAKRIPRGFDPDHRRMDWLRLQAFFVWKPYSMREFYSRDFAALVVRDSKQILRLNKLLEQALEGRAQVAVPKIKPSALINRLEEIERIERKSDF